MKLNKPIFMIGRRADNLEQALKKSPDLITIWIRIGKFKNKYPLLRSSISYQTNSTNAALDYKKRFISSFSISKSGKRLSVLKGISQKEVRQLLFFTKRDREIRSHTYDYDYFKSKKTFRSWKRRGKTIYTLIDRTGKLYGMIWNAKGIRTIRIYPPARGKRLSKKFSDSIY